MGLLPWEYGKLYPELWITLTIQLYFLIPAVNFSHISNNQVFTMFECIGSQTMQRHHTHIVCIKNDNYSVMQSKRTHSNWPNPCTTFTSISWDWRNCCCAVVMPTTKHSNFKPNWWIKIKRCVQFKWFSSNIVMECMQSHFAPLNDRARVVPMLTLKSQWFCEHDGLRQQQKYLPISTQSHTFNRIKAKSM